MSHRLITRYNQCKHCLYQWKTQGIPTDPCTMCGSKHIREITKQRYQEHQKYYNTVQEIIDYEPETITHRDIITGEKRVFPGSAYFLASQRQRQNYPHKIGLI